MTVDRYGRPERCVVVRIEQPCQGGYTGYSLGAKRAVVSDDPVLKLTSVFIRLDKDGLVKLANRMIADGLIDVVESNGLPSLRMSDPGKRNLIREDHPGGDQEHGQNSDHEPEESRQ